MRMLLFALGLGVAILPACSKRTREDTAARGVLRVGSAPRAEVAVDGRVVGKTPLTYEASPGPHQVVLRAPAFLDLKATVEVAAGATRAVEWVLTPTDPSDPVAIRSLADAFELAVVDLEPAVRERGLRDAKRVVPLYPRGDVRLADLTEFRVETGTAFEPAGSLAFRRGKNELHAAPFAPAANITIAVMPGAVQTALKPGAQVKWGYYPTRGEPVTARFKVVREDPRLRKRLTRMQKRLAGQPDLVLQQMRAQLYLNKRLYLAAYLEARKAYARSKFAAQAIAIMQNALRRMHLDKTALWEEVQEAAANVPPRPKARPRR